MARWTVFGGFISRALVVETISIFISVLLKYVLVDYTCWLLNLTRLLSGHKYQYCGVVQLSAISNNCGHLSASIIHRIMW